jgi:nitrate reductase NapE component
MFLCFFLFRREGILTKVADQAKTDKAYLAVAFTLLPVLLVFVIGYGHVIM